MRPQRNFNWKLYTTDAGEIVTQAARAIESCLTLGQVIESLRKRLHRFNVIVKRPRIRGRRKYVGVYRAPEGREILFKISK